MTTMVHTRETRARGQNHRAERRRPTGWNEVFESPTWLDSREFKLYALRIATILLKAEHPLSTREIHDALGADADRRWTQDALEAIRNLGKTGILPTRYFILRGELAQPKKLDQDKEHDRIFEN